MTDTETDPRTRPAQPRRSQHAAEVAVVPARSVGVGQVSRVPGTMHICRHCSAIYWEDDES